MLGREDILTVVLLAPYIASTRRPVVLVTTYDLQRSPLLHKCTCSAEAPLLGI
jgi:hypothetical protein